MGPTKAMTGLMLIALAACWNLNAADAVADKGVKQPVLLFCPHAADVGSLSMYVMVDPKLPTRILSLGLECLSSRNSKNSSYWDVLKAQTDPNVKREFVCALDGSDFGRKTLQMVKEDALHVTLTPQKDGTFELMLSMRISYEGRFVIGGKDRALRNLVLAYDSAKKTWCAKVKSLVNEHGEKVPNASGKILTGFVFPIALTGVYTMMGMLDTGDAVMLMDRAFSSGE